ncbi:TraX family protein [Kluyvera cryocrescens]|uniref:TraX family protein n=1 Tax=Kluyvera cryocrescens TaxID=580 RepID=UPI002DB8B889|nr:TraX family protein [Kluyvera cryocrescens]
MSDLSAIQRRTFRLNILQLSPRSLDTIKLVAFLAMLLDHFNTLFLSPARPEMYAIGRMAFPLFCLVWAINIGARLENGKYPTLSLFFIQTAIY